MLKLLLFTSITINLVSLYILYKVYKEKYYNYDYKINEAWKELLELLSNNVEIRVNSHVFVITKNGQVYKGNLVSSLSELEDNFRQENKKSIKKYSVEKELKKWI